MTTVDELIIDSFAGGGGASLGISLALGREPDVAINHDASALAMHAANHPGTRHYPEDVWRVDPRKVTKGKPVGLLWASPDCRHFSRAKGGQPVKKEIRSLAWIVVKWAAEAKPRVIILENVREFETWGPLVPAWKCQACAWRGTEGQATLARTRRRCPKCDSLKLRETNEQIPDPKRQGLTFKRWVGRLRGLGYKVEWKALNAADYGAPTHRRRLFLVARRDGLPIVWPEATHGDPKKLDDQPLFGRLQPWRTAAEIIDWSIPCPSIFDRKKPLADKTLRRIALGLRRYVLEAVQPFIVPVTHSGERRSHPASEPLPTITSAHRGEFALCSPTLVGVGGADYAGKPAAANKPMSTVLPNDRRAVVAPILSKYHHSKGGESRCLSVDRPVNTLDTQNRFGLVSALLTKFRGEAGPGGSVQDPLPTITSGSGSIRPAGAAHAMGITAASLVRFNHDDAGVDVERPLPTVTSNNHIGLVYAFLTKYFGTAVGQELQTPLHTATSKAHFGLVMVEVEPGRTEPAVGLDVPGVGPCIIADIGLRMLTPRELARAQGFPDSYILTGTKSNQVAKIGNSVCPVVARALVEANVAGAFAAAC